MSENIEIEKQVLDNEDFGSAEVKVNPDFYIHNAIVKAQNCLLTDNIKEGFLKFRVFVEQIETLTDAANMIDKDYYEEIENFKKSEEYSKEEDYSIKHSKLANFKLGRLMTRVFNRKAITKEMTYSGLQK